MGDNKFKNSQVFNIVFGWVFLLLASLILSMYAYKALAGHPNIHIIAGQLLYMSLFCFATGWASLTMCRLRRVLRYLVNNQEGKA